MALSGVLKFFLHRTSEAIIILLLIAFLPGLPPNAKYSTPYKLVPTLPFESNLKLNNKLYDVEIWHKGDFLGPECFASYQGELYTSIHGGDVIKLSGNHITPVVKFGKPCKGLYQEEICGRPLGLKFDRSGHLYVVDAYYGIFKVDIKTGKKVQIVSLNEEIAGKKPKIPNGLDIGSNGDLYWTDSSTEFTLQNGVFDMLADGSGRLIHYDSKTKQNKVLMENLHFSNGVILSDDEEFVLVSESARNRIHRYYLKGTKKGTHDIFIDGLPGIPDNLQSDGKDGFLVPLPVAVDSDNPALFQIFGPFPKLRKLLSRLLGITEYGFKVFNDIYPSEFAEKSIHFIGHFHMGNFLSPPRVTILRLSKNGEILDSLHTLSGKISGISEAYIFQNTLYLGSPFNDYIARIPLAKIGWGQLADTTKTGNQGEAVKRAAAGAIPKPTTTTPRPTTTTPKPTTSTPKPTTTTPKPTTTTPRPTTTTPKPSTTTPRPTTTTSKPITTTPKPTTPKPITTTATPKPTTTTTTPKATTASKPTPTTTTPIPVTTTAAKSTASKPSVTTTTKPNEVPPKIIPVTKSATTSQTNSPTKSVKEERKTVPVNGNK